MKVNQFQVEPMSK